MVATVPTGSQAVALLELAMPANKREPKVASGGFADKPVVQAVPVPRQYQKRSDSAASNIASVSAASLQSVAPSEITRVAVIHVRLAEAALQAKLDVRSVNPLAAAQAPNNYLSFVESCLTLQAAVDDELNAMVGPDPKPDDLKLAIAGLIDRATNPKGGKPDMKARRIVVRAIRGREASIAENSFTKEKLALDAVIKAKADPATIAKAREKAVTAGNRLADAWKTMVELAIFPDERSAAELFVANAEVEVANLPPR